MMDFIVFKLPFTPANYQWLRSKAEKESMIGLSEETGEIKFAKTKHRTIQFFYSEKRNELTGKGSLSSFYCGKRKGLENLTFQNFCDALNEIERILEERLYNMKIVKFELGLNILKNNCHNSFVFMNSFLRYRQIPFVMMKRNKGKVIGVSADLAKKSIKIYDKSLQEGISGDDRIIRYETVYKGETLKNLGIRSLHDLKQIDRVKVVLKRYLKDFDESFFIDFGETRKLIERKNFPVSSAKLLLLFSDHRMWRMLYSGDREEKRTINRRFKSLIKNYPNLISEKNHFKLELEKELKRCYGFDLSK